jgi:integrase
MPSTIASTRRSPCPLIVGHDDLRDIIRLLACTGARLAEISGLEVQDVDLQEMTINIRFNATRILKNDPSVRTVPVVDKRAIEALLVRIAGKRPTDAVFSRYGREVKRTMRRPRSANG